MQLLERPPQLRRKPGKREPENPDALIKEARRLRRRRWAMGTLGTAALLGATTVIVALAVTSSSAPNAVGGGASAGVLPNGPLAKLQLAGPMAVAPDGALYIADDQTTDGRDDRVLVRLPDGRFRVIAGTGKRGFSGDGGPAVKAELSDVTDLAIGPNGTLYIADGGRVRSVSHHGVIRTIVGSGRPARTVTSGTPARSAALGVPLSIAVTSVGQLYISTESPSGSPRSQILRLTAAGAVASVRAVVTSAPRGNLADRAAIGKQLTDFDHIAVDGHGNIDVAGGPGVYGVWQITPNGDAHLVSGSFYTQRVGGADPVLEPGLRGAVYAATARGIFHVEPHELVPIASFTKPLSRSLHGHPLSPLYFATNPTGTLYADDNGPIGYQPKPGYAAAFLQHLVSVNDGHSRLLWQEHDTTQR
jgi:hypothetical protein